MVVCASPIASPLASAGGQSFFDCLCPPMPEMYLNSFANYYCINRLQTCAKCMLVCAGPNAGLLAGAGADGLSFFLVLPVRSSPPAHAIDVFKFFCQLFELLTCTNLCYHVPVQLPVHWPVPTASHFLSVYPSTHGIGVVFKFFCQFFQHK